MVHGNVFNEGRQTAKVCFCPSFLPSFNFLSSASFLQPSFPSTSFLQPSSFSLPFLQLPSFNFLPSASAVHPLSTTFDPRHIDFDPLPPNVLGMHSSSRRGRHRPDPPYKRAPVGLALCKPERPDDRAPAGLVIVFMCVLSQALVLLVFELLVLLTGALLR